MTNEEIGEVMRRLEPILRAHLLRENCKLINDLKQRRDPEDFIQSIFGSVQRHLSKAGSPSNGDHLEAIIFLTMCWKIGKIRRDEFRLCRTPNAETRLEKRANSNDEISSIELENVEFLPQDYEIVECGRRQWENCLSDRQKKVLDLLAEGHEKKAIALELKRSPKTIARDINDALASFIEAMRKCRIES